MSRHWIFLSVWWNLLLELSRAAFIDSQRESNLLQKLNWSFDRNRKLGYGLTVSRVLWVLSSFGMVWFLKASYLTTRVSYVYIKTENHFYPVHLSICLPTSPNTTDVWLDKPLFHLWLTIFLVGSRGEGDKQKQTRNKITRKPQVVHTKHIPEGMPLSPPQTCCSAAPCSSSP